MSTDQYTLLQAILEERGISIPEENVRSAAATADKLRGEFEKLRSVELEFLPPYFEPATAVQWIESYGEADTSDG